MKNVEEVEEFDVVDVLNEENCPHNDADTTVTWKNSGVDVICRSCGASVFVGRTKSVAASRQWFRAQLIAERTFKAALENALDEGLDITALLYTDSGRSVSVAGVVQKLDDRTCQVKTPRNVVVQFQLNRLIGMQVQPKPQVDGSEAVHVTDDEDHIDQEINTTV